MGEAADDAFDAAMHTYNINQAMFDAGCRRCIQQHDENDCPICYNLGWIDANGNPCEP